MTTCETSKRLRVRYDAPALRCRRRLLVLPPEERGSQQTLEERWLCTPAPDSTRETTDEFGNRVLEIVHRRIDREFVFELELKTRREHANAAAAENIPETGLGAFLLPSALCDLAAPIQQVARDKFDRGRAEKQENDEAALAGLAARICDWAYSSLRYTPGVTGTGATASQVLALGEGVCQDYAHLMIAVCRACAIPARYVSGYNPAEGGMHAWVEVLCGETWRAFDPSHARHTRPDCVFVAVGRDFRDVSPVSGKYSGNAKAELEVFCKTTVLA